MLAVPPALRAAFWLVSLGMHATAFAVLGGVAGASRGIPSAPAVDASIEVESLAAPPIDEAPPEAPVAARVPFVPPPPPRQASTPRSEARPATTSTQTMTVAEAPTGDVREVTPIPAAIARPARFVLAMQSAGSGGAPGGGASATWDAPGSDAAPLPEGAVTSAARRIAPSVPPYPSRAYAMGVEGDVVLSIVVTSSGRVQDARVVQRAGFGFDEAALADIRGARFEPARRDGRAVAVRMRWAWSFRLR